MSPSSGQMLFSNIISWYSSAFPCVVSSLLVRKEPGGGEGSSFWMVSHPYLVLFIAAYPGEIYWGLFPASFTSKHKR